MPPTDTEQLFTEQVENLRSAHGQGQEAFREAARQTLGFVAEYPNRIHEEGGPTDDTEIAVAYSAAMHGLSRVITDSRLRHDFVQTIAQQLDSMGDESSEQGVSDVALSHDTLPLILEAMQNNFPDEVKTSSNKSDKPSIVDVKAPQTAPDSDRSDAEMPEVSKAQPELETADPKQFDKMITALITRAENMSKIIQATNTRHRHITIDKSPIYDSVKLTLSEVNRETTIAHYPVSYVERTTYTGKGDQRTQTTLRVKQADFRQGDGGFSWPHGLEGYLTEGIKRQTDLLQEQVIETANSLLTKVRDELTRREKLFARRAAAAQKDIGAILED